MSKQALEAFRTKLAQDESLRNEMTRALSQDGQKSTVTVGELMAFAKSRGYDVSLEDMQGTMELDDGQLEAVSGGIIGPEYAFKESTQLNMENWSLNYAKISRQY